MRVKSLAAAIATVFFLGSAPAWAQADRLRVEHQVERIQGRPLITGYVHNDAALTAVNIRLLVEELDTSGQMGSTTVGYVDDEVLPGGRVSFQVPVPREGATYRVRVQSFVWHRVGY